jgi:hypothetical protein
MPDGRLLSIYDQEFFTRAIPKALEIREVPVKELYKTFEEFADACGAERDSLANRYGYWGNPNGIWDWYTIGGRWRSPFFALKQGRNGIIGIAETCSLVRPATDGWADHALKGDIDFEAIREEATRPRCKEV